MGGCAALTRDRSRATHARCCPLGLRAQDPDFHDGRDASALGWFVAFMRRYVTARQLVGQAFFAVLLRGALRVPVANLVLFWAAPSMLRCAP